MNIVQTLKGLKAVGFKNVWLALPYGLKKSALDAEYISKWKKEDKEPFQGVGKFDRIIPSLASCEIRFSTSILTIKILRPSLVKFEWRPGKTSAPYLVEKTDYEPVPFVAGMRGEDCEIRCGEMRVVVKQKGNVEIYNSRGALVCRHEPPGVSREGACEFNSLLEEEERIFGMGQRNCQFNLRGRAFTVWNSEAMGDYKEGKDPIYFNVPMFVGLHKKGSYMVFFENSHYAKFSFKNDRARARFYGGALDYYVGTGDADKLLDIYTELTGRPAMPPRWALGYHQARWSYMNEKEALDVAAGFKRHEIKASAIHLDIHYMNQYRIFTVDPARFPNMKTLADKLRDQGIKLVLIIDPGVKVDEKFQLYKDGRDQGLFVKGKDGKPVEAPVWAGMCAFPDFTNPKTRHWWGWLYRKFVEDGVDGFWHDMNEPAAFSSSGYPTLPFGSKHDFDGEGGEHAQAHNLYALLQNKATYEGLLKIRPNKRPWILSRSGFAGSQRYSWNWTGDTGANWWSMRHNIRLALMLGLSGMPYTGPDTGGFNGDPGPELYIRWLQYAAFMPFFRTHSAAFVKRREPWSFGEPYTSIARTYINLRYSLMPYIYTAAYAANQKGAPLVRPIWWREQTNETLLDVEDEFLLGQNLLVAPICKRGAKERQVVLPSGSWYDFYTDENYEGGRSVFAGAPLEKIPLYVREGTILPMESGDALQLRVYLNAKTRTAKGTLYSDEGDGYGAFRVDKFSARQTDEGIEIVRAEGETDKGEFRFPYKNIEVFLCGLFIKDAICDGKLVKEQGGKVVVPLFNRLILR